MTESVTGLSDEAVDTVGRTDPCAAIALGLAYSGERLTDFSPGGHAERQAATVDLLRRVRRAVPQDESERVAREVMIQQFENAVVADDAGDHLRDINVLFSPPQHIRMALEFADTARTAPLLEQVGPALAGWRESLERGLQKDLPAARRQAVAVAEQLSVYGNRWLPEFGRQREAPEQTVAAARRAYLDTATWLSDVYASQAAAEDAVGEERYERAAWAFTGSSLDLDDTFAWGWEEIARLTAELRGEVERWRPGLPVSEAREILDDDPAYRIEGVDRLRGYLADLTSRATDRVDGVLFDLDPRVRECRVEIAAEGAAAAPYYMAPSEDLSRPGSTWYPTQGAEVFPRWWLESVWFHEGVPGHHLQLGAFAVQDSMARYQRLLGGTSGHAEGWALYAERLCDENGWFDDSGTRIGFLSAQLMRAVRVVVDIGLHTPRRVPAGFPGARGAITAQVARRLLEEEALVAPDFAASEVDRYLGMPGQAISYKVGERVWRDLRDDASRSDGFDLRDWHMYAMRLGPMGLDQFRDEMRAYPG